MSTRKPSPQGEPGWIGDRMEDPEFCAAIGQELAAQGFVAQVRRVLDKEKCDRLLHETELARRLGWTRERVVQALSTPSRLTIGQASAMAHVLKLRLRVVMEP